MLATTSVAPLLALASPLLASPRRIVTAPGSGAPPHAKAFDAETAAQVASFFAFDPGFTGGVRVAYGDVNGDGAADLIAAAGPGGSALRAWDGRTIGLVDAFLPFGTSTAGMYVGAGDFNSDGRADYLVGTDSGVPAQVKVFDGSTTALIWSFFPYGAGYTGGVRVAAGDVTGDGVADLVTGSGPGAAPHVKVFDGTSLALVASFFAFSPTFTGGIFVAAGDVTCDGRADLVVGSDAGASQVSVFDGSDLSLFTSFLPFSGFTGGVRVATGHVDGDGLVDLVVGTGAGAAGEVKAFDATGGSVLLDFLPYASSMTAGIYLASGSTTCFTNGPLPRPVPDGQWIAGSPLRVDDSPGYESVTFDTASCESDNYNFYWGWLGSYAGFAGAICDIGRSGTFGVAMPGDSWWLIAGTKGNRVSSFGRRSDGSERSFAGWGEGGVCPTQLIQSFAATCP